MIVVQGTSVQLDAAEEGVWWALRVLPRGRAASRANRTISVANYLQGSLSAASGR